MRGCGAGTFGPTAHGAGRGWGCGRGGRLLRPIHHPERSELGGYHRVRGGWARRSYPLHFRLSRARPRWLPEGSIHHGGKGWGSAGVGELSGGAEREGVAGTRSTVGHPEKHGEGRVWVRLSTWGRGRALCPGEDEVQGRTGTPSRLLGCSSLGAWPRARTGRGSMGRGAFLNSSPGEAGVERWARTWTLWGDPAWAAHGRGEGRPEGRPYFISPRC